MIRVFAYSARSFEERKWMWKKDLKKQTLFLRGYNLRLSMSRRIKSFIQIIRLLISLNKKKAQPCTRRATPRNRVIYASVRRESWRGESRVISSKLQRSIIHPLISFNYLISSQFAASVQIDISIYGYESLRWGKGKGEGRRTLNRESAAKVPVLLAPYRRAR